MLILQGGRDYQVTTADFELWRKELATCDRATLRLYPKLNHLFIAGEGRSTPAEYGQQGRVDQEVIDDIAAWVLKASGPAGEPAPRTIAVPFTRAIKAADLTIERLTVEVVGDQARFAVTYASGRERFLSFFDPPSGGTIKHVDRTGLKPGAGVATFAVPLEKLRAVSAVTMRFSGGSAFDADANFISLSIDDPALRSVFGERSRSAGRPGATQPAVAKGEIVREVAPFADLRGKDVSKVTGLEAGIIAGLRYNEATRWSAPEAKVAQTILQRGMDPGLGVRGLHRAGVTGAGVSVGIIDQNIYLDHPEFKERLVRYNDVGCNASSGSMHGPAVASLLVGKNIGTAPGARLFFAAAPSWTADSKFQAEALHWLLDVNAKLPAAEKIRVISVSAAPSGRSSPFKQHQALWDEACDRATQAGVLVLDCTTHRGIIAACYYDGAAPDDLARVTPGFPGKEFRPQEDHVYAPSSRRTVAEEYTQGRFGYQYTGVGGLSWAIPYAAGVLALGWQVNPVLPPGRMVELLRETAYLKDGIKVINPVAFVDAVRRQRP
jgi:hypothetical protein